MYRIQVFDKTSQRHIVLYAHTMEERTEILNKIKNNPDKYGHATFEYLPRGFSCY